ncbi:DUF3592 domain-containing protein [soil metagenome]
MLTASALLWTRIGAGVCLLVVANLIYALFKTWRQVAAGKVWARTTGKITVSKVSRPGSPGKGDETATMVEVRYQYRAGDRDFEGNQIKFGGHAGMSALAADEIAAKYPLGATVDVYYDPKTPGHAALEPSNKSNVVALVVFLVVFTVISAVLTAHAIAGRVLYTQNGVPLFGFTLPLFSILVAIAAFMQYVVQRRRDSASKAWPTVWGKIIHAGIVTEQREEKRDDDGDSQIRIITRYRPDVRFAYIVDGREFHSGTWKWGWTSLYPDEQGAKAATAKYAAGTSVPVFYNATKPDEAVLEPGNRSGSRVQLMFGAVFALGGLLMLWAFSVVQM